MIFTAKYAGKWVATRGDRVVATSATFAGIRAKVERRKDRAAVRYELVPPASYIVTAHYLQLKDEGQYAADA